MRVGIISEVFLPKIDGVVNRTLNLMRHLPRHGDELLIVCPSAPGCNQCPVPVVDVPSFSFPLYPEYRIGLPDRRLAETLHRFRPDVLHYVNPFAFGFCCNDVLQQAGVRVPSVFSFHTLYGEFVRQYKALKPMSALIWWLMREYHNRADVNLTVSGIMQADLIKRGFERVELWPPAVDSELFRPERKSSAMRSRLLGGDVDRPLLLTVSRLAPEKNVGFLADVLRAIPGAMLAVIGDGPARADLERQFQGTDARFLGYLKGEELASAYASADAFVYASETETMGNVVLEAMACGCPVVAPYAGGIPNLMVHGTTGFLYRPRDERDASTLTRALLDDSVLRATISHAARQAVENCNWEHSIGRVRQAYLQAIEQPRPRSMRSTWSETTANTMTKLLVSLFRSTADRRKRTSRKRSSLAAAA
ncbi:MAG: glycosyltransferase family 1 protein [Alphaproteobacteria bacterium]|nr:glycosyltransferase family 1 protein [Alphaproteobacteria bacterium]